MYNYAEKMNNYTYFIFYLTDKIPDLIRTKHGASTDLNLKSNIV
jgi:hypothetical protein